jgi:hypothetical protein
MFSFYGLLEFNQKPNTKKQQLQSSKFTNPPILDEIPKRHTHAIIPE